MLLIIQISQFLILPPLLSPLKTFFLSAVTCVALLPFAIGQTLTSSSQYGIPIVENVTEIDETGQLALFDSNLGTLTAVILNLYGAGTTELTISNNSVSTVSARIVGTSDLVFSSGLAPLDSLLQSNNANVVLQFPTGTIEQFAPGETRSFGPLAASASLNYDLFSIIHAMQAPGGGTFSLNAISLNGLTILGGGGNLSSAQRTTAGTGASIHYTYLAIPEPGSALLLALATMIPVCRRRRAR